MHVTDANQLTGRSHFVNHEVFVHVFLGRKQINVNSNRLNEVTSQILSPGMLYKYLIDYYDLHS